MDRISALRNVEDALRAFEEGEADLHETEATVATVLRTYATEFDGEDDVFQAIAGEPDTTACGSPVDAVDGRVVVAPSKAAARVTIREMVPEVSAAVDFELRRL